MDIFITCPVLTSEHYTLRQVCMEDWEGLLKVYSDTAAVPIFNSDNCTGDFYMTTEQDMKNCIDFWLREYAMRYYIRWSIVDNAAGEVIGTIELFHRTSDDYFNHVGLLRLDLRSDHETESDISRILAMLLPDAFTLFSCDRIATKIPPVAQTRIRVLTSLGFRASSEKLFGHDGRAYGDYFLLDKQEMP